MCIRDRCHASLSSLHWLLWWVVLWDSHCIGVCDEIITEWSDESNTTVMSAVRGMSHWMNQWINNLCTRRVPKGATPQISPKSSKFDQILCRNVEEFAHQRLCTKRVPKGATPQISPKSSKFYQILCRNVKEFAHCWGAPKGSQKGHPARFRPNRPISTKLLLWLLWWLRLWILLWLLWWLLWRLLWCLLLWIR